VVANRSKAATLELATDAPYRQDQRGSATDTRLAGADGALLVHVRSNHSATA
jgi:hypothetical protein